MVDWETKPLGELCEFRRGLTYGKSDEVDVSSNVVLRANNVDLATYTLDLSDLRYISDSVSVPATKKVRRGSLLICTASGSKSHLGKIAYVDDDYGYAFGGFMGQITPAPGVNDRYLFHALTSPAYKAFIEALSDGVNINNLKFDDLRQFPVPIPDLDEQQRIVAILDEAFEGIATAKANAEKNLQNARELYECQLESLFASGDCNWPVRPLAQLATIINGYAFKSTDFQRTPGVRSIKITNVGVRAFVDDASNYLPTTFSPLHSGVAVTQGSIVLALTRSIIAGGLKVAMVPIDFDGALLNQRVAAIQPHTAQLETAFLFAYLSTRRVMNFVKSRVNTLMQPNLSIGDLRLLPVPLPALSEQHALVEAVQRFKEDSQKLESTYVRKLAALDDLKKSLLHQAFTGAL